MAGGTRNPRPGTSHEAPRTLLFLHLPLLLPSLLLGLPTSVVFHQLSPGGVQGAAAATSRKLLESGISCLGGKFRLNGESNAKVLSDGSVAISLTKKGGQGVTSKSVYSFGQFSIDAKLMKGYSAGVCATFFLISGQYDTRSEFDFEFLGSATDGRGMTLQTNYFEGGVGEHEILMRYGFDPSHDFHTYTIDWQPTLTKWYVDGRLLRTVSKSNYTFPRQPMQVALSIWDASEWATGPRDARIPVNYWYQPFTATFRNFKYESYLAAPEGPAHARSASPSPTSLPRAKSTPPHSTEDQRPH